MATPQSDARKQTAKIICAILIIGGGILALIGAILFGLSFSMSMQTPSFPTNPSQANSWFNATTESMNQAFSTGVTGIVLLGVGGTLCMIGIRYYFWANIGRISTYIAQETAPAATITSRAFAHGMSEGLNEGGGVPVKVIGEPATSSQKIMIKCRSCGALNDE